ncbi:MAG TPA: hypothetical protein VFX28_21830 [Methylomirabilota bacterium]|nr:hypothetical protein [Methylomirabilota bacterium]
MTGRPGRRDLRGHGLGTLMTPGLDDSDSRLAWAFSFLVQWV